MPKKKINKKKEIEEEEQNEEINEEANDGEDEENEVEVEEEGVEGDVEEEEVNEEENEEEAVNDEEANEGEDEENEVEDLINEEVGEEVEKEEVKKIVQKKDKGKMTQNEPSTQHLPRNKKVTQNKKNDKLAKTISEIFLQCQKTISCHSKNGLKIEKELKEDYKSASEQLFGHINGILAYPKKDNCVEKLIIFLSKLCSTLNKNLKENDEENFSLNLLEHLLKNCDANNKTVRYRCTEMISKILPTFKPVDIPEDLQDYVLEQLTNRAKDKYGGTRAKAIKSLSYFKNNTEVKDEIRNEYIFLLHNDPESEVRMAAIKLLEFDDVKNLDHFLQRTRDTDANVRKLAYFALQKQKFENLNSDQKISILKGTLDQYPDINQSCIILTRRWLNKQFGGDVGKFLDLFDFNKNQEIIEKSIPKIIEGQTSSRDPKYFKRNLGEMTTNIAFFWRIVVQNMWESQKEDKELELILPPLIDFSEIIGHYFEQDKGVLRQLLLMIPCFDYGDEQGRKVLMDVLVNLLPKEMSEETRKLVLRGINVTCIDESEFLKITVQTISSLTLNIGENELQINSSQNVSSENRIMCLSLTEELLSLTQFDLNHQGIAGLLHPIILPSIQSSSAAIRLSAINCLGIYILISRDMEIAREYILLFLTVLNNDTTEIKQATLKILFDILNVFGFSVMQVQDSSWIDQMKKCTNISLLELFASEKEEDSDFIDPFDHLHILQMFSSLLFGNRINQSERLTIVEGFLKLFLSSRLKSPKCIAIIVNEFWKEQENTNIKRCIQAILPYLVDVGKTMKKSFERCLFHSIKLYVYERAKYVAAIDPTNQFKYLYSILEGKATSFNLKSIKQEKQDDNKSNTSLNISSSNLNTSINENNNNAAPCIYLNVLAFQICSMIQKDPQSIYSCMSHVLPLIKLDPSQTDLCEKIKNKALTLTELVHDSALYKKIVRFGCSEFQNFKASNFQSKIPISRSRSPTKPKPTSTAKRTFGTKRSSRSENKIDDKIIELKESQDIKEKISYFNQLDSFSLVTEEEGRTPYTPKMKSLKDALNPKKKSPTPRSSQSQKKFCKACNMFFPEGFNFCGKCGGKTEEKATQESSTQKKKSVSNSQRSEKKEFAEPLPIDKTPPKKQKTAHKKDSNKEEDKDKGKKTFLFSGITDGKKRVLLAKQSTKLKATVLEQNGFDPHITHVISPPNNRTLKTLCAALTSKWIVSPEWVEDSSQKNKWLPEKNYGTRTRNRPFKSKKVFITESFLSENKNTILSENSLNILIVKIGKGEIVKSKKGANIILTARDQADNLKNLNYDQLLQLIQPID